MSLTSVTILMVLLATTYGSIPPGPGPTDFTDWPDFINTTQNFLCPDFGEIDNGFTKITEGVPQIIIIECNEGYDLEGATNIYCKNGKWNYLIRPKCNKLCYPPPSIKNGSLVIEDVDQNGMYRKGALATYTCWEGFKLTPKESRYRVCEKGIWTGAYATCEPIKKITNCPPPKDINNGYFVQEKSGEFEGNLVGQRLHYSCNSGYVLVGTTVQQCLDDGTWSPKIPPICSLQTAGNFLKIFKIFHSHLSFNSFL